MTDPTAAPAADPTAAPAADPTAAPAADPTAAPAADPTAAPAADPTAAPAADPTVTVCRYARDRFGNLQAGVKITLGDGTVLTSDEKGVVDIPAGATISVHPDTILNS